MSTITLKVNGAVHTVDVEPLTPLLTSFATILAWRVQSSAAASGNAARAP